MSSPEPPNYDADLPAGFAGTVRLFPLPNLVMFPHVLRPLHIFEPRYRALVQDALADDGLIAMALLQPGWEADYEGRHPVHAAICVGRIVSHTRLEDGKYNLALLGLRRALVMRELPPAHLYRQAEVAVMDDVYPSDSPSRRDALRQRFLQRLKKLVARSAAAKKEFAMLLGDQQLPLGALTDIVAYALHLELLVKQRLLTEPDVEKRAALLLDALRQAGNREVRDRPPGGPAFPPGFSEN